MNPLKLYQSIPPARRETIEGALLFLLVIVMGYAAFRASITAAEATQRRRDRLNENRQHIRTFPSSEPSEPSEPPLTPIQADWLAAWCAAYAIASPAEQMALWVELEDFLRRVRWRLRMPIGRSLRVTVGTEG